MLCTKYVKDVMISSSETIALLKDFFTAMISLFLLARCRVLCLAIVGDSRPTPGRVNSRSWYEFVKEEGAPRRCKLRYARRTEMSILDQSIWLSVNKGVFVSFKPARAVYIPVYHLQEHPVVR